MALVIWSLLLILTGSTLVAEQHECNVTTTIVKTSNESQTEYYKRPYTPVCNLWWKFIGLFTGRCLEREEICSRLKNVTRLQRQTKTDCCPGYKRVNKTSPCLGGCDPGLYGENCTKNCTCPEKNAYATCEKESGNCTCLPGWIGENCTTDCPDGSFGDGCSQRCGCEHNATCNRTDGTCICTEAGWTGEYCDKACNETSYGINCNMTCECETNQTCDSVNGNCTCKPGYSDVNCTQECNEWKFGLNCSESCSCNMTNAESCDVTNGTCDCKTGYTGQNCSHECTPQTFGKNCAMNCNCSMNMSSICNSTDGVCFCKAGKTGNNCTEECPGGHYGIDCLGPCDCMWNNTVVNSTCEPVNGTCNCIEGWNGPKCDKECNEWTFGLNCSESCSCNMTNAESCDVTNGTCDCKTGYTGQNCSHACASGQDCTTNNTADNSSCNCDNSTTDNITCNCDNATIANVTCDCGNNTVDNMMCHCANTTCHPDNMKCICKTGWTGINCETEICLCSDVQILNCTNSSCECHPEFSRNCTNGVQSTQRPRSSPDYMSMVVFGVPIICGVLLIATVVAIVTYIRRKRSSRRVPPEEIVINDLYINTDVLPCDKLLTKTTDKLDCNLVIEVSENTPKTKAQPLDCSRSFKRQENIDYEADEEEEEEEERLYTDVDDVEHIDETEGVYDLSTETKRQSLQKPDGDDTYNHLEGFQSKRQSTQLLETHVEDTEELYASVDDDDGVDGEAEHSSLPLQQVEKNLMKPTRASQNQYSTFKQIRQMPEESVKSNQDQLPVSQDVPPKPGLSAVEKGNGDHNNETETETENVYNKLNYEQEAGQIKDETPSENVYNHVGIEEDYDTTCRPFVQQASIDYGTSAMVLKELKEAKGTSVKMSGTSIDEEEDADYAFCEIENGDDEQLEQTEQTYEDVSKSSTDDDDEKEIPSGSVKRLVSTRNRPPETKPPGPVINRETGIDDENLYEECTDHVEVIAKTEKTVRPRRSHIYEPFDLSIPMKFNVDKEAPKSESSVVRNASIDEDSEKFNDDALPNCSAEPADSQPPTPIKGHSEGAPNDEN